MLTPASCLSSPPLNFHHWVPACFLPGLARPPPRAQAPPSQPMQSPHTTPHMQGFNWRLWLCATSLRRRGCSTAPHMLSPAACPPYNHASFLSHLEFAHIPFSNPPLRNSKDKLPHHTLLPAPSKGPCVAAAGYAAPPGRTARFFLLSSFLLEVFAVRAMLSAKTSTHDCPRAWGTAAAVAAGICRQRHRRSCCLP